MSLVAPGVLPDRGQRGADLDAFETFGDFGGLLHFQRVLFDGLEAHRQFRLVLRQARAVEALGDFLAFAFEGLDLLFQLGIARFQLFHALEQFFQRGRVIGRGEGGQGQPCHDQRGRQLAQFHA